VESVELSNPYVWLNDPGNKYWLFSENADIHKLVKYLPGPEEMVLYGLTAAGER